MEVTTSEQTSFWPRTCLLVLYFASGACGSAETLSSSPHAEARVEAPHTEQAPLQVQDCEQVLVMLSESAAAPRSPFARSAKYKAELEPTRRYISQSGRSPRRLRYASTYTLVVPAGTERVTYRSEGDPHAANTRGAATCGSAGSPTPSRSGSRPVPAPQASSTRGLSPASSP